MNKRYIRLMVLVGLLSLVAAQFVMRTELRAYFSIDYWQSVSRYGKVMRIVESQFVHADEVNFKALTDIALREAVRSLDGYSDYMTVDEYHQFNMASKQEYVGVGIEVGQFSGRVVLTQVFEQGVAAASGMLAGDFIVGVDGVDTRTEVLGEVVRRIRGEPGTEVRIEVERPMTTETLTFYLERQAIALDSVIDIEMKTSSVGYLRVRQFIGESRNEMLAAITTLQRQGMEALVIDLRGNPGGRLDTAVAMAEVFLQSGQKILTVQSRRGVEEMLFARDSDASFAGPMAILIDRHSASASEILAGALRDHRRAVLIGENSFGKGSVQSVYGFRGGDGLKLTSARYLLPGGEAINGTGVAPNLLVERTDEEAILLMLQKHHLRRITPDTFAEVFGFHPVEDSQVRAAVELLGALSALMNDE